MRDNWDKAREPDNSAGFQAGYYNLVMLVVFLVGCAGQEIRQPTECVSQSAFEKTGQPPIGQVGDIMLVDGGTQVLPGRKVFVATFQFQEDKITTREVLVAFGTGKTPQSQQCDFWFELVDVKDNILAKYGIWNPRKQIADEHKKIGFVEVPVARLTARFPFSANAKEIRVLDAKQHILESTDVRPAINLFCETHKRDSDCRSIP